MTEPPDRFNVSLPPGSIDVEEIDAIVEQGDWSSRSEFVRAAIAEHVDDE